MTLSWQHEAQDGAARAGVLHTAHGEVPTPVFMPVGTAGTVKAMTADAVRATGARMVLGNTYHLMLRPGAERIARLGGLHRFMDWHGPILTDSGGFQVMSLSGLRKMDADGVTFQSHIDGSRHRLTPERSVEIQHLLGADVTMCFDECTPFPATHEQAATSMRLSMRRAAVKPSCIGPAMACSALSKAVFSLICARKVSRHSPALALKAMRWAGLLWAKARKPCSPRWNAPRRCCPPISHAI
jgi:queuine tRNA-ribosyltransferase